jgi:hypothetical protein
MRRNLCVILMGAVFLAACGGGTTPAPTADTNNASTVQATAASVGGTPIVTETPPPLATIEQQQRAFETDEAPLPIPGTLDASTNPDTEAGLVFDDIQLERTGGIAGQTLTIVVNGDGTFTRDGVAGTISPDQVTIIDTLLDQMNFFGLQGVFTAPGTGADVYTYSVRVSRAGSARTIRAQDGFIPPELIELLSLLSSLGAPTAP